jgi:lysophospholipase L1-like esterase
MSPYHIIQRGYGGAKLSDFAVCADRIFSSHKCKAIVIFIANDITGTEQDKTPKEVGVLCRSVLKTIRKSHPLTPVFWIAITPTVSRWKVWPEIQKVNVMIRSICENKKNTYFIKTDFAFLNENGLPKEELFRDDKLHLTDKGYAVWTEIIKKELNSVLR